MKSRLLVVLALLVVWCGLVAARLYNLQVVDHERYRGRAERQQVVEAELEPPRGSIFDARGRQLAVSLNADSAYAVGRDIDDIDAFVERVGSVVDIDRERLARQLARTPGFVWVARQLDQPVAATLRALEVPSLGFLEESRRYYPQGAAAAAVVGFVGIDHRGLEGLERRYDEVVSGQPARRRHLRDARLGTLLTTAPAFQDAEPGADLHLTIDATVQFIVERELESGVLAHGAKSGVAVLMNPRTGAILAMATYPGFDPNRFGSFPAERRRNRVVMDAFEPGSTFKLVTAAAALERNLVDPNDVFDCENGATYVSGKRIRDHHPFDLLTFREIIGKSSNVGAIKIGLLVGEAALHEEMRDFGFGARSGIDLPGENPGIVRPVERWARREVAYASFGQGMAVSALQMASAFAAIANDGLLLRPYVVAGIGRAGGIESLVDEPRVISRPITKATAFTLERMLETVVEDGGTGTKAAVDGYRVAGKTGTAQKAGSGGYSLDRHLASFVGFVPARDPEVVALVAIDEPQGALFHGGDVAAPVFAAILRQVLPYLGVGPTAEPGARWPRQPEPELVALARGWPPAAGPAPSADGVPDFAGLTARQALVEGARRGITPRLLGSGLVVRQAPPPGTSFSSGGTVELWLATGPLS